MDIVRVYKAIINTQIILCRKQEAPIDRFSLMKLCEARESQIIVDKSIELTDSLRGDT